MGFAPRGIVYVKKTAPAPKPSLQSTACLTTHALPAAVLQQCVPTPPWTTGAHGHKPSNNRALSKPLVAVMALCVAATRNMLTCCLHTPPEASPKVEAPEGPPLAASAIRPPEPRRVLRGSHEGASTACYSLWPRQNSECAGPRKAFTCSLCGPTAGPAFLSLPTSTRGESEGGGPGGASTCCIGDPTARPEANGQRCTPHLSC